MTVRPITVIGHKALAQPTKKVREVTDELRTLIADMVETCDAADGAGLASTQVGSRWRVFVYACEDAQGTMHRGHVINPVLTRLGPVEMDDESYEGCLSVPGEGFLTARHRGARVTGTDLDGNPVELEDHGGVLARCLQHEVDHLDGKLYIERLAPQLKREALDAVRDRGWRERGILSWDPTRTTADQV